MAKDLDIKPRKPISSAPRATPRSPHPALPTPPETKEVPAHTSTRTGWIGKLLIILTLLLVVGIITYLYYESLQTTSQAPTITAQATNLTTTPAEKLTIKVYDGGSGPTAVESTIQKLKESGYDAENAGKNLTVYDQTYIWYTEDHEKEAKAIATLLNAAPEFIRKSQFEGSFALQIFLGKN